MSITRKIELQTGGPYDLAKTLSLISLALRDPCIRIDGQGAARLAIHGPSEPVVVGLKQEGETICAEIAGPDADWLAPLLPAMLGLDFTPPQFAGPPRLKNLARKFSGLRLPRVPLILPRLVQIVLQQLVRFEDACHGWKELARRYGTKLPGHDDLFAPPTADVLSRMASFQFIECGILPEHGRRINTLARAATRIESGWNCGTSPDSADRTCDFLLRQRGVGPWTIGSLRGTSMGDADAVVLGDYSLPKHVAYFFGGEEIIADTTPDDKLMLELLEPFRPHRYYVTALLMHVPHPTRRGPRRTPVRRRMGVSRR